MPQIRPLSQLARYEYETLKVMDVLLEIYPHATGDWGVDSRSPFPGESSRTSACEPAGVRSPTMESDEHAAVLGQMAR